MSSGRSRRTGHAFQLIWAVPVGHVVGSYRRVGVADDGRGGGVMGWR